MIKLSCVDILEKTGVKTIVLIGGEPTLYKKIVELVAYIKRKNLRVAIATNGRRFSEENFARIIAELGVDSINIFLKATTEEKYLERTRDKGLYEAIRGYHNFKHYGINASLSYVVCNDDKKEITELIQLLRENILFQFVKPVIEEGSREVMSVADMAMMTEFIYEKMQQEHIPYMFEISFPFCALKEDVLNTMIEDKRISSCCHVQGEKGIVFDTNLRYYHVIILLVSRIVIVGLLIRNKLLLIFLNRKLQKSLETLLEAIHQKNVSNVKSGIFVVVAVSQDGYLLIQKSA